MPSESNHRVTRVRDTTTRYLPPSTARLRSADMIPTVASQATMLSHTTWIGGSRGLLGVPSRANTPVTAPATSSNPVRFDHGPVSPCRLTWCDSSYQLNCCWHRPCELWNDGGGTSSTKHNSFRIS